jgi:hypothetical protein
MVTEAMSRLTIGCLIIFGILSVAGMCMAEVEDGNKLLTDCGALVSFLDRQSIDSTNSTGMGFCSGLMQGLIHMNQIYGHSLKDKALFCTPDGVNNGQAARIVVKYLRAHPEELHKPGSILAFAALKEAFPCAKTKQ